LASTLSGLICFVLDWYEEEEEEEEEKEINNNNKD
jgi:hypothetical protein